MGNTQGKTRFRPDAVDLSWICGQVSLVLRSGIPVREGLEMLAESAENPRIAAAMDYLAESVGAQRSLSDAMTERGGFPEHMIMMTRVGELSGTLDTIMAGLSDFYERSARLSARIRSALTYPIVLLVMMAAVIVLLVVRVLPIFSNIFTSLGSGLPAFSGGVLRLGQFLQQNFGWMLGALAAIVVFLILFFRTGPGRRAGDRIRLSCPGVRRLFRRVYASRFSMAMAHMLGSGMDMDTSLEMAGSVVSNEIVRERIASCREAMGRGEDPFDALGKTGIFPRLFIRMLAMGSKSGELDTVMEKVARSYEGQVQDQLNRLTGIVEPLLVVILSAIVGGILLTVMLPLIDIMSSIG